MLLVAAYEEQGRFPPDICPYWNNCEVYHQIQELLIPQVFLFHTHLLKQHSM